MDFYSYNVSKKIIDLKMYYNFVYAPEMADKINHLIDNLVKLNYSDEEIEVACDTFCRIVTNPIPILDPIESIKNEINKEERKYEIMTYSNINNKTQTYSTISNTGTIKLPSLFFVDSNYKEEKDNKLIYGFNIPGIRIKCEEIWNNREKKLSLRFYGENKIFNVKNCFDKTIDIDTDVYEKDDWTVKDGILYVTLFEKINERPDFHRVEKGKSPYKKKDTEATPTESETE